MALVSEPTARKVSPIFFIIAALCFLLPFAAASCDSAKSKDVIHQAISASPQGAALGGNTAPLDACIDAFGGFKVTYTGWDLLTDKSGSTTTPDLSPCQAMFTSICQSFAGAGGAGAVSQCVQSASQNFNTGSLTSNSSDSSIKDDPGKPYFWIAIIAILVGLVIGALKLPMRGLIAAVLAAVGAVALLVGDIQVGNKLKDLVDSSTSSGGSSGFNLPSGTQPHDLFSFSLGYGLIIALVVLIVALLYNLGAQFMGGETAAAPAMAGGYGGAPPPAMPPATPPPGTPPAAPTA